MVVIKLCRTNQVKYLSGLSRSQRRCKLKKQAVRPVKRQARNLENTNETCIMPHISQHNPEKPIIKFKNSFVCYGNSAQTEIIAVVKFYPFEGMDPARKADYERLSKNLLEHTRFQKKNSINGNTLGGDMFILGWRKGFESNSKLGVTAIGSKVAQDPTGFIKAFWDILFVNDFLAARFQDVSEKMYHEVKAQHNGLNGPSLVPFFFASPSSFCCHVSFTFNNFYNKPHKDQDSSPYSFGMWIPVNRITGELVEENLEVEGGEFVLPNDGCAIDFSGFNGVVECSWKASKHEHHTLKSTTPHGSLHTRLGLSCQLPDSAKLALENIEAGVYEKEKEDWTFRDLEKIVMDAASKYDKDGKIIKKKNSSALP